MSIHKEECRKILLEIRAGRFSYSDHGEMRSLSRSLPVNEVIYIANHLISWVWQEDKKTYLIVGHRTNGKGGGFSAVNRNGVIIVTVFKRTLKKSEK